VLDRADELDVSYRGSSLVAEAAPQRDAGTSGLVDRYRFARGLRPGDRAPDARIRDAAGRPLRLFDRFRGPHTTLLLFAGARPAEHLNHLADRVVAVGDDVRACLVVPPGRAPAGLPVDRVVIDADGEAHRLYGAAAETLYLVRPDGHIGFRSRRACAGPVLDHLRAMSGKDPVPVRPA